MTNQTTPPDLIERVARALCAADPDICMGDAKRIVQLRVDVEWKAYVCPAQAAIAAIADYKPAPVAPSGETSDEFIAEALRLMGVSVKPATARLCASEGRSDALSVMAHAATLHKLAVAREALGWVVNGVPYRKQALAETLAQIQ